MCEEKAVMAKEMRPPPMLDQLESGPWPSFVTGLKRLAKDKDYMVDLLGQLEHSYKTRKGYWKGGTVGVFGYGGGGIPRFTEAKDADNNPLFPDAAAVDAINELGFDLGGAGPAVRTSMSCVGATRCEQSCYDEASAHRTVINSFLDDIHRPSLPYKFKFTFSGCPNDCMNSIQRSDRAIIGTWRDNIRTDEALAKKWFAKHGMDELVNDIVARCPTKTFQVKEIKKIKSGEHFSSVAVSGTHAVEID